ncbi:MAG: tRNA 2-thiouridine(34) synthase MnmA [Candidatus Komeilibacteria bacterium]|nr:tRNA 2-thiouridine(34) synthase MnmA [Candidatus Komeilibacteria bacterium]
MSLKEEKVIVALSGGVDSSVTCALLLEQGYAVEAIFMKNWTPKSKEEGLIMCPLTADEKDARLVASQLGIKLSVISFEKEYRADVVDYMFKEYQEGRTPNPDVLCNSKVKFNVFLKKALSLGADFVATGHYVRKFQFPNSNFQLLKGVDPNKDQTYFLYQITQDQLEKCLFPIGEYAKPQVRELAKKFGLATASKPDSQGICFVGEVQMKEFLKQRIKPQTGDIITVEGKKIGEHEGVWFYTVGQRKGIGIGGGMPYYVIDKDLINNRLIVARGDQDEALFKTELICAEVHWIAGQQPKFPLTCSAKIRYRQEEQSCQITKSADSPGQLSVSFKDKQRAITPGQFIVFYKDDECLGGGKIL